MYLKSFIDAYISNGFDFQEAKTEIDFVLEVLFNYSYKDFLLNKQLTIEQIKKVQKIIDERVKTNKPLQQILGTAFFYGRRFFVNEYTLIPRPETELLVQEVINITKELGSPKIIDIGTGTGCIGLTLMLENPKINANLSDIQQEAIETAKKNALYHNILSGVKFIKSDLFENITDKYDVIVSNPPYIPLKDKNTLQIEVREYDSPVALFTKDDEGIEFYEKIIRQAQFYLNKQGFIAFELGINQADTVKKLLKKNNFYNIKIIKDFNSVERVITAKIKPSQ